MWPLDQISKLHVSITQTSTLIFTTITEPPAERRSREHLSDTDIAKILALDKASTSQREIASFVKCSQTDIQRVLATYTFKTFQRCNPRQTYQRKTTQRENWYIKCALKQNDSIPLRNVTNIVRDHGILVSEATIWHQRSEIGLGSYITAEKCGLHAENFAKRLEWAMKHKDLMAEDWKCVIWCRWIRCIDWYQFTASMGDLSTRWKAQSKVVMSAGRVGSRFWDVSDSTGR